MFTRARPWLTVNVNRHSPLSLSVSWLQAPSTSVSSLPSPPRACVGIQFMGRHLLHSTIGACAIDEQGGPYTAEKLTPSIGQALTCRNRSSRHVEMFTWLRYWLRYYSCELPRFTTAGSATLIDILWCCRFGLGRGTQLTHGL